MTPQQAIADLDGGLAVAGQTVTVKRRIANSTTNFDSYTCKAVVTVDVTGSVDGSVPDGMAQRYRNAIFSPTDIPSSFGQTAGGNPWPDDSDSVVIGAKQFLILGSSEPRYINQTLVRINARLIG